MERERDFSEESGELVRTERSTLRGTALIVDDNHLFAEQIRRTLRGLGLRAESAYTLDEALALLTPTTSKRKKYDWLLLDLFLQRQTCEPLLDAAMRLDPPVGVVVMTGFIDAERIAAVKDRAFVLMKPFMPEQLVKVLQATDRRQALTSGGPGYSRPVLPATPPHGLDVDDDLPLLRRGPEYVQSVCGRGEIVAFGAGPLPEWLLHYWDASGSDRRYWHTTAVDPEELDFSDVVLVLVDESIEGEDALAYCRELRESGFDAPLLMTGRSSTLADTALSAGADSFAKTGTWGVGLYANTLLRSFARIHGPSRIELDYANKEARVRGRSHRLTPSALGLLGALRSAAPRALSVQEIAEKVFGANVSDEAVHSAVDGLRASLGVDQDLVATVQGGYRLRK